MPSLPAQIHTPSWHEEKPLPTTPSSPTLTIPENILPHDVRLVASPPRVTRRPPSPSYLQDDDSLRATAMGRKEKLGLVSRKMNMLRSRAAGGGGYGNAFRTSSVSDGDFIPSSPILQDVGNLAPEQPERLQVPDTDRHSNSGGSSSSDISGLGKFLAKYERPDGTSDDEALYEAGDSSPVPAEHDSSLGPEDEADAERRKQRQDEYNSAILSKRAEQILANAKKRLNVMEGNLRGARDLVAPLTAANLKRAASLGSAHYSPAYGRRYGSDTYGYAGQSQPSPRMLQSQASSPTIGRDFQGHNRGFSETELPERPYSSLENVQYIMSRSMRSVQRSVEPQATHGLRSARSHDSLGGSTGIGYGVSRDRSLHARDSPDSTHLEPLAEADELRRSFRVGDEPVNNGLGIYRPSSQTSDLREQMSTLKGKISNLKERAREQSLRRQSQTSLRNSSPFNNAMQNAPEFFYASSSNQSSPVHESYPGDGWASNSHSPISAQAPIENRTFATPGSRNAFAEQASAHEQTGDSMPAAHEAGFIVPNTRDSKFQNQRPRGRQSTSHSPQENMASGAAIGNEDDILNEQRQAQQTTGIYAASRDDDLDAPSPESSDGDDDYSPLSSVASARPEDDESVYEDARDEQKPVVAHEDREDAFDYENFFLHSAMGTYGNGRRGSGSSEGSASSAETAKGPTFEGNETDDGFEQASYLFPPPTPETPEKLKEIERNLHKRTFSDESISSVNTYATADEPQEDSPEEEYDHRLEPVRRQSLPLVEIQSRSYTQPFSQIPQRSGSGSSSRPGSRPSTAVKRVVRRDSSSKRADSGVGLPRRSTSSNDKRRPPGSLHPKATETRSAGSAVGSPPTSPSTLSQQDPAAAAITALLEPSGRPLGLRNNAILFGLVESLRHVVQQLQEGDELEYESQLLRKRLEEAKLVLDGRPR